MELRDFNFKKKYGQNFLNDITIPRKIVDCANIKENSLVIEIGPGAGIMTKLLSENPNVKQVLAYEIDESLEPILDEKLMGATNVDIIYDDFMNRNVAEDLNNYDYSNLYVVANLPYYITTPIILKLIEENLNMEKVVIMIQKEVADRFSAQPKNKEYGSITVFLNYYFDIRKEFSVSRNLFTPKPNVDSMVISLNKKKKNYDVKNKELFFNLVRDSFKFKRKTLKNNLKNYDLNNISKTLEKYHLDLSVRAEALSIEIFIDICNNL